MARGNQSTQTKRRRRRPEQARGRVKKRACHFCAERLDYIDYKDTSILRRYMSDRAKIRARSTFSWTNRSRPARRGGSRPAGTAPPPRSYADVARAKPC